MNRLDINGKSMELINYNLNKLEEIFPEVFSEGKIDFNKLKILLGDNIADDNNIYEFKWSGKDKAIKSAITPSNGTLRPDKESSKNWEKTENLYIEGDNLEVLKLLQKSYFGKIKMIYIDPPYNTGQDFVYKDDFKDNLKNYKEMTNQATKTNTESNGRFHTDWINMIYPRIKLGRNLLREDGVMFISIDDNEVNNLKKVCDEIFGENGYVATIPWRKRVSKTDVPFNLSQDYEWILVYAKSKFMAGREIERKYHMSDDFPNDPWRLNPMTTQRNKSERPNSYFTVVNPKTGDEYKANPNRVWAVTKDTFSKYYNENKIVFPGDYDFLNISQPMLRVFKSEEIKKKGERFNVTSVSTVLPSDIGMTSDGTKQILDIFGAKVFSFPKPYNLIKYLMEIIYDKDAIILDFFGGSSTTAHATMKLNSEDGGTRKFILVQLPEVIKEQSEAFNLGYKTICDIGKDRIRKVGEKIVNESGIDNLDIGFKVFKLDDSNMKIWDPSYSRLEETLLNMRDSIKDGRTQEDLLYEILIKMGIELTENINEINVENKKIFNIGKGSLLICLEDEITENIIKEISKYKSEFVDMKVVFKETGFKTDSQKMNAVQNLKQFGITDVRSV